MNYYWYYDTMLGRLTLAQDDEGITLITFGENSMPDSFEQKKTPLIGEAIKQLDEYFGKKRRVFDLPLSLHGTEFEKKDWNALLTIPYGQTRSYGEIAAQIGSPKACRAVGRANGMNPIAIVIPCHRVIGANGTLTGYSAGLDKKKVLLDLEGIAYKA